MATIREIQPAIQKILDKDLQITKQFIMLVNRMISIDKCRTYFKALELSCQVLIWWTFSNTFKWLFIKAPLIQIEINMLFGLILVYILVAVIRTVAKRRRPVGNRDEAEDEALGQIGHIEESSFPSRHATAAVCATYFFLVLHPLPILWNLFIIVWCAAICASRVLRRRHYVLDVVVGMVLGILAGKLLGLLYIEEDTAKRINKLLMKNWIIGEFHV